MSGRGSLVDPIGPVSRIRFTGQPQRRIRLAGFTYIKLNFCSEAGASVPITACSFVGYYIDPTPRNNISAHNGLCYSLQLANGHIFVCRIVLVLIIAGFACATGLGVDVWCGQDVGSVDTQYQGQTRFAPPRGTF